MGEISPRCRGRGDNGVAALLRNLDYPKSASALVVC